MDINQFMHSKPQLPEACVNIHTHTHTHRHTHPSPWARVDVWFRSSWPPQSSDPLLRKSPGSGLCICMCGVLEELQQHTVSGWASWWPWTRVRWGRCHSAHSVTHKVEQSVPESGAVKRFDDESQYLFCTGGNTTWALLSLNTQSIHHEWRTFFVVFGLMSLYKT